ncbi:unnamed protein product [Rhodiola kirilowii]
MLTAAMPRSHHDSSFSLSRRYFNLRKHHSETFANAEDDDQTLTLTFPTLPINEMGTNIVYHHHKHHTTAVSKLRSALTLFTKPKSNTTTHHLGTKVIGTLFGSRRGHINFAIQEDPKSIPAFIIELPTTTSSLVKELASGVVRILLECDKKRVRKSGDKKLLMEPVWRSYCNGKKCGYAARRDCGGEEWRVLKAVEMMTAGAGVLPEGEGGEEEVMYMRAKFERVVGSRHSEAFYMVSPEGSGGPELSVLLFRV